LLLTVEFLNRDEVRTFALRPSTAGIDHLSQLQAEPAYLHLSFRENEPGENETGTLENRPHVSKNTQGSNAE